MSANAVISNGISDSELYLQSAANVKAPFAIENRSGQYPAVGNIAVNRKLASMWQGLFLDAKVFADGLGITSMNATEEGAVAIRIPILLPAPRNARTLTINLGSGRSLAGTPGNDGGFNNNMPHGMQTDAADVWFRQIYDEAAQISKSQMRMIGKDLNILGQYTANIPQVTALLTDADVMATQVGAALKYKKDTGASNVVFYNPATTTNGYLQSVMNALVAKMSNVVNGYKDGVISYPAEKSVIIMRYSLWTKLLTINNGALVNSDIAQKILINGKFTEDGKQFLGGAIMGKYNGIYIKVVPDELWVMAAAYMGISKSNLQYLDKVSAYIANAAGTYFGRSAVETSVEPYPGTSIGFVVKNDWQWGTTVIRPTSIALLVESANNGVDFVNPITDTIFDVNNGTVAPRDLEMKIQEYNDEAITGSIQAIGVSNLVTDCTLTLTDALSADIKNAVLTVISNGAVVSYQNNGDSTYSFTLGRGDTAHVIIEADGYVTATLDVAATDTAEDTKSLSKTLTAAGD